MRMAPAVLALVFVLSLPVAARSACADSALRIVEILAGPTRDWDASGAVSSRDDEWIELLNVSPSPLDLSAFFVTDADSIPRCGFTGTLAPGARRLVFGGESVEWERATGHPVFGLSLANSGDSVLLWQVAGAETLLVDAYTYRSHEAAADRSVGRAEDSGPWVVFDGLNPYTGTTPPIGNGCDPTIASPNVCHSTPARPATWGALKHLYR